MKMLRAHSALVLILGLLVSACSRSAQETSASFAFVNRVDQAEAVFDPIRFRSVRKDGLLSSPVTLAGETQSSLTPPLPSPLV